MKNRKLPRVSDRLAPLGLVSWLGLVTAAGCGGPEDDRVVVDTIQLDFSRLQRVDAESPEHLVEAKAREVRLFSSAGEMTATSDVVIRGTVTEVRPGRTLGTSPEDALQMRVLRVRVDEVLGGDPAIAQGSILLVEEPGWIADGRRLRMNHTPILRAGDSGYFFLGKKADLVEPPVYYAISSQGLLKLAEGGGQFEASEREDALSPVLERMAPGALRAEIELVARQTEEGVLAPQPAPPLESRDAPLRAD